MIHLGRERIRAALTPVRRRARGVEVVGDREGLKMQGKVSEKASLEASRKTRQNKRREDEGA